MQEPDNELQTYPAQDLQTQNLRYVGLIINTIVHRFNNTIGVIHGYADLSLRAADPQSRAYSYLKHIKEGAEDMKELTQKMRILGKREKQERRLCPIHSIIGEAVHAVEGSLPPPLRIQQEIDGLCKDVPAVADQIRLAVINLCSNAVDAVRENNGRIKVALKEVEVNASSAQGRKELREGRYAKLTVSDTGHGMDQEALKRVFEPFFTTQKTGEHAGLGLALVRAIVKGHDGAVFVESKPGEGTAFDIYLPLAVNDSEKGEA